MSSGRSFKSTNPVESTKRNLVQDQHQESTPLYGVYQGVIIKTDTWRKDGTVQVQIDAISKDPSLGNGFIDCTWTSPFAGTTPALSVGKNIEKYEETQKSYGLWMMPPDIGNHVLVVFGDGDIKNPYIIACVWPGQFAHMIPGMPRSKNYADDSLELPVAEKNKKDENPDHDDSIVRPVAPYLAEAIVKQGLANDPLRGAGGAGSRREAPSQVFGILTPGPLKEGSSPVTNTNTHRLGGHQFVMDDNLGSRMIRLRTGGGAQLLLDDTTSSIYMINNNGTGWFEIDKLGNIQFYAKGSINIRSKGNLNLRADKNINIEAGNDLNLRAAGDNIGQQYTGNNPAKIAGGPPTGTGGAIRLDAAADIQQFAALNYGVTAAGGDVDISAGNRVAITPSGPLGFQLLCPTGPVAITAATNGVSINGTAGIGLTSAGAVGVVGTAILLNSGPGFTFPPAPAIGPGPIGLNDHKDQSKEDPEFDLEAALEGKAAVKNKGQRPGRQDTIKSIVTCLITSEPYAGHGQGGDTGKEDPTAQGEDPTVTDELPPAASTQDGKPDDAQTPVGSKAGEGYVDNNGNTVSQPANSPSVASRVNSAAISTSNTVSQASNALNDGASKMTAQINKLNNAIPTYSDIKNATNDFTAAIEKKIGEILGLGAFVAAIKAQIPPIRFPTVNAIQQKVIASVKQLKELEAQLQQFSLDQFGLPIDLNIPAIQDMKNSINAVMAQAKDGLDAVNKLKDLGIDVINDAGSLIYQDPLGNTLVDFSNGVGPVTSSLAVQSEITKTYNNVKNAINVPINDNQAQALAAFAKDIGEENFRNSNVVKALNEGKYNEVPRLMTQWSLGPKPNANYPTPTDSLVFRQDFKDKRYFQGQVFQSPDNLDLSPPDGTVDGELSALQMGDIIKARREEFNAANFAGFTEYYGG